MAREIGIVLVATWQASTVMLVGKADLYHLHSLCFEL